MKKKKISRASASGKSRSKSKITSKKSVARRTSKPAEFVQIQQKIRSFRAEIDKTFNTLDA